MSGLQGVKSQVSKSSEVSRLFLFLLESLLNQSHRFVAMEPGTLAVIVWHKYEPHDIRFIM